MSQSKFATAINCMDGRVQLQVTQWIKDQYQVEYVDMITEAGPAKVLLSGTDREIEAIKNKIQISQGAHGSETVAIIGHHDCAGNPIPKAEKCVQIKKAVDLVDSWGFPVKVIGLYVNEDWDVETVTEI